MPPRRVDRHVLGGRQRPGERVALEDVERAQAGAAVHVHAELPARVAERAAGVAAELEVVGADGGAIDAAGRRGGGEAILVGDLTVAAVEEVEAQFLERAHVGLVVFRGEAVRVLFRIEEAHRARVVARAFDVAAAVALVADREKAAAHGVRHLGEHARVFVAGVEDLARRAASSRRRCGRARPAAGCPRRSPSRRRRPRATRARRCRPWPTRVRPTAHSAPPCAWSRRSRRRRHPTRRRPSPDHAPLPRLRALRDRGRWRWRRRAARSSRARRR